VSEKWSDQNQQDIGDFVIPSGDLYRVVVAAHLLQLYQNRIRLLKHVNYSSPPGHLLGHPTKV